MCPFKYSQNKKRTVVGPNIFFWRSQSAGTLQWFTIKSSKIYHTVRIMFFTVDFSLGDVSLISSQVFSWMLSMRRSFWISNCFKVSIEATNRIFNVVKIFYPFPAPPWSSAAIQTCSDENSNYFKFIGVKVVSH